MRKFNIVLVLLTILLLIALSTVSIILYKVTKKEKNIETIYYGQRGNISDTSRIEFLSKNEEFLVGMIGVKFKEKETEFSKKDMVNFALYVAKYRYENILPTQTNAGKIVYRIDTKIIDDIIEEFFGETDIAYNSIKNDFYSSYIGAFLFNEEFEKTMWFYPVDEKVEEISLKNEENPETNNSDENNVENEEYIEKYIIVTADSIFINETEDPLILKEKKYSGKYNEEDVEYTIVLKFNEDGKLVSYQYKNK